MSIEWLHRSDRGMLNRGELTGTVFVAAQNHTLVRVIPCASGDPAGFIHVGSIPVTAAG